MPSLGADMEEGTLVAWRVAVGDTVRRGDIVAVVATEKSDIEVEVFESGTIGELLVDEGATVAVGTPLARIDAEGAAPAVAVPAASAEPPMPVAPEPVRPAAAPVRTASPHRQHAGRVLSPLVRRDAAALGVDLAAVEPADPDGPIHRSDVAAAASAAAATSPTTPASPTSPTSFLRGSGRNAGRSNASSPVGAGQQRSAQRSGQRSAASPYARRLAAARGVELATISGSGPGGAIVARDVPANPTSDVNVAAAAPTAATEAPPVDPMRAAIARTMERSNREIPHYYLAHTVDLSGTTAWLADRNADRPPAGRLLLAALELRAVALAARKVGEVNGTWVDGRFVPGEGVHLGVIVALRGGGLLAPVIRDADQLDLDATMATLADLVERARRGTLRSSELSGATLTVTNLGEDGVEEIFGVIHPPQVAIVGFGGVVDRPVAVDGQVVVHPTVRMTLAADHRASDGRIGGRFLSKVASLLATPTKL